MGKAKPIVHGQIIMATARTIRGEFWLRADEQGIIKNLIGYLITHYATLYNIQIHSLVVMSNHYHMLLTDPHAHRPAFFQQLHSAIARHIKSRFQRNDGQLFKKDTLHQMVLLDQTVIEDKHIYTITNPVCAHIVEHYQDYNHLLIDHHDWHRPLFFQRPAWFSPYTWHHPELILIPTPPACFLSNSDAFNTTYFEQLVDQAHREYDKYRMFPVSGMDAVYTYPRHYSPNAHDYIAIDDHIALSSSTSSPPQSAPPPNPMIPSNVRFYRVSGEDRGRPDFCTVNATLHATYSSRITSWDDLYIISKAEFHLDTSTVFPACTYKLAQYGVAVAELSEDDVLNPTFYQTDFVHPSPDG